MHSLRWNKNYIEFLVTVVGEDNLPTILLLYNDFSPSNVYGKSDNLYCMCLFLAYY